MKVFVICLLVFALGLASAAPRLFPSNLGRLSPTFPRITGTPHTLLGGESQTDKMVTNQVISALAPVLGHLGKEAVKYVVCDHTSRLQEYTDNEERDAKIMALVKSMSDMLAAQEILNKVKKLNMEGNLVTEAGWFDSISDAVGGAVDVLGDAAKGVICSD